MQPRIEWSADGVRLVTDGAVYTEPMFHHQNGEPDAYRTLALAAGRAAAGGIELARCASCARFRFSGMSHQMSGGTAGYCGRVGFRNRRAIVVIDHGCGEHERVAGWPHDLDAALAARLELAKREPIPDRLAAYEGAMIGLAAGDALGTRHPGAWSDNLEMSIAAAEALLDAGTSSDLHATLRSMASSLLTHLHPPAVESAAATALLIALALEKRAPAQMHRALIEEHAPGSPDLATRLAQVPQLLDADPAYALSAAGLGEGRRPEEAVASALWCFWRSPDDFHETVRVATNAGGATAALASIAGGISGAFNGIGAIPATWRDGIEGSARLHRLAASLWTLAKRRP
jgi:ADP-ribosylglycohydrolase